MPPPNARRRKQKQRAKNAKPYAHQPDNVADDLLDDNTQYQSPQSPPRTQYSDTYNIPGQYEEDPIPASKTKQKSRKAPQQPQQYPPPPTSLMSRPPPPPPTTRAGFSDETLRTMQRRVSRDPIWDTNSQEERARIKEFWLTLPEDERKSLVKIEKEAVLRKMKEQQKHSCSCTVCGRKRTAIEEELEVLYDAYYEELEQFANHNQQMSENGTPMLPAPTQHPAPATNRQPPDRASINYPHGRVHEIDDSADELDEEDNLEDDELDEEDEYSEEDYDDEYTSNATDEVPGQQTPANDFFSFGKSLTVKGGILTVADDLLKNDGQKFIDMMEQLAERRMQREEDAAMAPYRMTHPPMAPSHSNHHPPPEEDEYSEEDDEEYDDSQGEELDEDEDEMDTMTEEQRMEEGRRMFQIFAARMFEQRVLTAYKEKVARDRQEKLIAELEAETNADTARDAKKARDAEKKRLKKAQQKAAKAEEKAKKDEEKRREEEAAKEAEEARKEELKKKREEMRRKKEAERKAAEEEKLRKEAEKQRRQQLERERQQEAERKAREAKAEEKRKREELRKKERDERDAREAEARVKKEQADLEKKQQDAQSASRSAEDDTQGPTLAKPGSNRADLNNVSAHSQPQRPQPPTKIALPPGLKQAFPGQGQSSPQLKVAAATVPRASTSIKSRDAVPNSTNAHKHSHSRELPRSPKSTQSQADSTHAYQHASHQPFANPPQAMQNLHHIPPPPGMPRPNVASLPGYAPSAMPGYPGAPNNMIPPGMGPRVHPGQQMLGYPPGPQQMNFPHRPFGMNSPGLPPPGAGNFQAGPGLGRGFPGDNVSHGFHQHGVPTPGFGLSQVAPPQMSNHSRQTSASFDPAMHRGIADSHAGQAITRPTPINRPTSVKPPDDDLEVGELSKHLGSSALLDESDEPLPLNGSDARRPGATPVLAPGGSRGSGFGGSPFETSPGPFSNTTASRVPSGDSWARSTGIAPGAHQAFGTSFGTPATPGWGAPTPQTQSGWGAAGGYSAGSLPRSSMSRPVAVRQAVCQACRGLSSKRGHALDGGFESLDDIVREIGMMGILSNNPVRHDEVENILDTEGDAHNGGGSFEARHDSSGRFVVKWKADSIPAASLNGRGGTLGGLGLGEIGSPIPGNSLPNLGGHF